MSSQNGITDCPNCRNRAIYAIEGKLYNYECDECSGKFYAFEVEVPRDRSSTKRPDADCPRCIQDWLEDDVVRKGISVPASCKECEVCVSCEHFQDCSEKSN